MVYAVITSLVMRGLGSASQAGSTVTSCTPAAPTRTIRTSASTSTTPVSPSTRSGCGARVAGRSRGTHPPRPRAIRRRVASGLAGRGFAPRVGSSPSSSRSPSTYRHGTAPPKRPHAPRNQPESATTKLTARRAPGTGPPGVPQEHSGSASGRSGRDDLLSAVHSALVAVGIAPDGVGAFTLWESISPALGSGLRPFCTRKAVRRYQPLRCALLEVVASIGCGAATGADVENGGRRGQVPHHGARG
jgi:hypothetical protein